MLIFLKETGIDMESIDGYAVADLYSEYKDYCTVGGYKILQKSIFDSEIHKQFNVEKRITTRNGRSNKTRWVVLDD